MREGDQLKLQSSRLRAHDSSRSMNLRVCAGLPQTRDEPSWGKGEASQSTCLRVVDSGEDPELQEDEASRSTCLRVVDRSSMRHYVFCQRILSLKMRDELVRSTQDTEVKF